MKRIASGILMTMAAMILSCESHDIGEGELRDGTYTGIFYRASPDADWMVASVTLTLDHGSYTGTSDIAKYPAICRGTYLISGQNVTFTNECAWTADFDWTFILTGTFKVSEHNNQIVMTRVQGENTVDTYKLTRQ